MSGQSIDCIRNRRRDRLYQQKHRQSKRCYVTEIEDLKIILAWQHGDITEGHAAHSLGVGRLKARTMRDDAIDEGAALANAMWEADNSALVESGGEKMQHANLAEVMLSALEEAEAALEMLGGDAHRRPQRKGVHTFQPVETLALDIVRAAIEKAKVRGAS